jgi:predicted ATPase
MSARLINEAAEFEVQYVINTMREVCVNRLRIVTHSDAINETGAPGQLFDK